MAASRILAMVHLAMQDAVNAAKPRYHAYAYQPKTSAGKTGADAAVAAAVAAHDVLTAMFPKQQDMLRATLDATLHDAGIGAAIAEGKKLGAAAAAAMLARRANDGSQADEDPLVLPELSRHSRLRSTPIRCDSRRAAARAQSRSSSSFAGVYRALGPERLMPPMSRLPPPNTGTATQRMSSANSRSS